MVLARRLQDAWKVLWGRSEPQQEIMRIRSDWLEVRTDIANTLAKLSTWAARQAKQEQRKLAEHVESATTEPAAAAMGAHPPPHGRKAELRRRLAEARGLPSLRGVVSLTNPPEEESP